MASSSFPGTDAADGVDGFDPRRIAHTGLRTLYDYWRSRSPSGLLPPKAIVDPVAMRPWLGNITLVDVAEGGRTFRIRLCGSALVERLGLDLTGRDLSAIPDEAYRERLEDEFRRVAATGRPSVSRNRRRIAGTPYDFEILRLPLGDNGRDVSNILICTLYFEIPPLSYAVGTGRTPRFEPPIWLE